MEWTTWDQGYFWSQCECIQDLSLPSHATLLAIPLPNHDRLFSKNVQIGAASQKSSQNPKLHRTQLNPNMGPVFAGWGGSTHNILGVWEAWGGILGKGSRTVTCGCSQPGSSSNGPRIKRVAAGANCTEAPMMLRMLKAKLASHWNGDKSILSLLWPAEWLFI